MALPYSFATTTKSSVFSKLHNTSFFQHNQLQRANVGRYFKLFHSSLLLLTINFLFLIFISMNCPDKL
ncbi:uncharacterized protein DS421_18g620510 [Arachis hypogaea]|nr:uncharacterized protein DS421_18g620510 [Arachis hypogaea]